MTLLRLTSILEALYNNTDPLTGEPQAADSCLVDRHLRDGIDKLIRSVAERQRARTEVTEAEIAVLRKDLEALGFRPTAQQIARVLTGSRTIADPRLRGLPAHGRYHGVFTRRSLAAVIAGYAPCDPGVASRETTPEKEEAEWKAVEFFDTGSFDKLEAAKATELGRAVTALGFRKDTERLPNFMARARVNLPRAFEPWTREEKALLIEAMCYTNDPAKLALIFGRSEASIIREGKKLIWNSRQKVA